MEFIINEITVLQTPIWQNTQNLRLNMGEKVDFAFIRGALKAFSLLTGKVSCKYSAQTRCRDRSCWALVWISADKQEY